jgi:general secretion pathway protein H
LPTHWLVPGIVAEVVGASALVLGPEPLIGAQRVSLRLDDRRMALATDGLGPFVAVPDDETTATR